MRSLYAERQATLVEAAERDLKGLLDVRPSGAGMHLVGRLPPGRDGTDDRAASRRAAAEGVEAPPLSLYRARTDPEQYGGLLLGYAAVGEGETRAGVKRLAAALGS
jgi:GntR family transcriptional regulator/MocR family aminotransferase